MNSAHHSHHSHDGHNLSSTRSIAIAFAITAVFAVIETVGGAVSKSLALTSDAAHMGTDLLGLAVSWLALWWGSRARKHHIERVGAAVSMLIIWFTAGSLSMAAVERLQRGEQPEIQGGLALAVSALGLIANIISLGALRHDKDHHINVQAAYLHVATDLAGSVASMISASIILLTGWYWVDTWVSFLLILGILWSSWQFLTTRLLRN